MNNQLDQILNQDKDLRQALLGAPEAYRLIGWAFDRASLFADILRWLAVQPQGFDTQLMLLITLGLVNTWTE
jgi:hypothetical protein